MVNKYVIHVSLIVYTVLFILTKNKITQQKDNYLFNFKHELMSVLQYKLPRQILRQSPRLTTGLILQT